MNVSDWEALLEAVYPSLYIGSPDGFMPSEQRPPRLRASILGRLPPWEREA